MARVHVCSTLPIPTYKRLATFARERGILHPSGEVNTSDAIRTVVDLHLGDNDESTAGRAEDDTETRP
jgi:hypothetical protein